jgi:hypothetical protein
MANKTNSDSPLVASVLALQTHLDELERIGGKINTTDMSGEVDADYVRKLLTRFAECGQSVSQEVLNLSTHLQQAQTAAQSIAAGVSRQASAFKVRTDEQLLHLEKFESIGERVRELNASLTQFRQPGENGHSEQDPAAMASRVQAVERELIVLINDLRDLRNAARDVGMRKLEKDAESLGQTLQSLSDKLRKLP